jgi:DNA-binding MarR family transcriptional regulator
MMEATMTNGDEVIHQATRLRIMTALNVLDAKDRIEFTRLKVAVAASDGNLGAHLETLERAGYVEIEKQFADRKPQTCIRLTRAGRKAYAAHVSYLRSLLEI